MDGEKDFKRILDLSMNAGRVMLENGAEIFRVEDTMRRIATHYGVKDENFFVLTNGIFISATAPDGSSYSKVEHIPVHGADLHKVIEINQLSRDICEEKLCLEAAAQRLEYIRTMPRHRWTMEMLATILGAASFALILGGGLPEAFAAGISGLFLGLFNHYVSLPYLSKVTGNILGAAVVTICCIIFQSAAPIITNMRAMIGGATIPLVPGVAFVNGIRDIADSDYISGAVRLLDAILVFTCIAVGVAVPLLVYTATGGVAV